MNSLLLAVGLSSCVSFADWTAYYYQMMYRSNVFIPKSWMIDGIPQFEPIIEYAYELPADMSTVLVKMNAKEYCEAHDESTDTTPE